MTDAPKRIQRKRTKGWKMPEGAVYVGRPTKWGNPFQPGRHFVRPSVVYQPCDRYHGLDLTGMLTRDREHAVELFRRWVVPAFRYGFPEETLADDASVELRGLDLACWCPLEDEHGNRVPCHADVLLEIANGRVEANPAIMSGIASYLSEPCHADVLLEIAKGV